MLTIYVRDTVYVYVFTIPEADHKTILKYPYIYQKLMSLALYVCRVEEYGPKVGSLYPTI